MYSREILLPIAHNMVDTHSVLYWKRERWLYCVLFNTKVFFWRREWSTYDYTNLFVIMIKKFLRKYIMVIVVQDTALIPNLKQLINAWLAVRLVHSFNDFFHESFCIKSIFTHYKLIEGYNEVVDID